MDTLKLKLTGRRELLMHNGQLADPRNPKTRAIKALTGGRNKTDDTLEEIRKLEWLGGLYLDPKGRISITEDMLLGAGYAGAKTIKKGTLFKAGVLGTEAFFPLEYKGPKDPLALYEVDGFVDYRGVVVQRSRVFRARPRFNEWSLTMSLMVDASIINTKDVVVCYEQAGRMIGLGDFRPRFGRFEVTQLKS
jgi:hypothetical protein